MVSRVMTLVKQSPNSHTQYIVIPAAMTQDSQYPFMENEEVEITIAKKALTISSLGKPLQSDKIKKLLASKKKEKVLHSLMKKVLEKENIAYTENPGMLGSPDFLIGKRIAIFCFDSYWHGKNWDEGKAASSQYPHKIRERITKTMARDEMTHQLLKKEGIRMVTFWDSELRSPEIAKVKLRRELEATS